jgi:hypothetical protein
MHRDQARRDEKQANCFHLYWTDYGPNDLVGHSKCNKCGKTLYYNNSEIKLGRA